MGGVCVWCGVICVWGGFRGWCVMAGCELLVQVWYVGVGYGGGAFLSEVRRHHRAGSPGDYHTRS